MTTKVKKFTGGAPSRSGEEGSSGEILTKLSNQSGDYGWRPPAVQTPRQIQHDDSRVTVRTDNGLIEVFVNNNLIATFSDTGQGLVLEKLNGATVATDVINPASPPTTAEVMLTSPNDITKFTWTPAALSTLISYILDGGATIPVGMISPFPVATVHEGWLECNGEAHAASEFPELYDYLGTEYSDLSALGVTTFYETPDMNQTMITGGVVGGYLYYVYLDISTNEYRLRKTDVSNSDLEWEVVLPGTVDYAYYSSPADRVDVFDWDSSNNVYIRIKDVGSPGDAALIKIDENGTTLLQTSFISGGFHIFSVNKTSGEVYFVNQGSRNSIRKTSNILIEEWDVSIGGGSSDFVVGIEIDSVDGSAVAISLVRKVHRISSSGSVVWSSTAIPSGENLADLTIMPDRNIRISVRTLSRYRTINYTTGALVGSPTGSYSISSGAVSIGTNPVLLGVYALEDGFVYAVESLGDYTFTFKINPATSSVALRYTSTYTPSATFGSSGVDRMTYDAVSDRQVLGGVRLGVLQLEYNTFRLPDLRGEFVRGWDHGRGVDSGRALGSFQADQNKQHRHDIFDRSSPSGAKDGDGSGIDTGPSDQSASDTGARTQNDGGSEARPRNRALMYCIKT